MPFFDVLPGVCLIATKGDCWTLVEACAPLSVPLAKDELFRTVFLSIFSQFFVFLGVYV